MSKPRKKDCYIETGRISGLLLSKLIDGDDDGIGSWLTSVHFRGEGFCTRILTYKLGNNNSRKGTEAYRREKAKARELWEKAINTLQKGGITNRSKIQAAFDYDSDICKAISIDGKKWFDTTNYYKLLKGPTSLEELNLKIA